MRKSVNRTDVFEQKAINELEVPVLRIINLKRRKVYD